MTRNMRFLSCDDTNFRIKSFVFSIYKIQVVIIVIVGGIFIRDRSQGHTRHNSRPPGLDADYFVLASNGTDLKYDCTIYVHDRVLPSL